MADRLISVIDAARELGVNKQHLFKVIRRIGVEKVFSKSSESHGQKIAYISRDDLKQLKEAFVRPQARQATPKDSAQSHGYFYLIELEPEHDPGRFKVGFASSVEERMRSHRTAAPLCRLVGSWPCKPLWEKTAIDAVTIDCERLYTEVFRTESMESVENRCQSFFALMPNFRK